MAQTPVVEFDYGAALNQAYAAYTSLMTGAGAFRFRDQNGEMVEYTPGNTAKLAAWIAYLEVKTGTRGRSVLGPLGVIF